ncbi:MAG: MerR family transcriptional regulator [bacterium]|nr:MerR family transcriptional regulator [bacterium]
MHPAIPDKLFFKIGEVAELTGTKPHVLRYWESEFKVLRPAKGESGQRVYRRKDVELIFAIKNLLYEENFTIAGAKRQLSRQRSPRGAAEASVAEEEARKDENPLLPFERKETLDPVWLRRELQGILDILDRK